MKTLWSAAWVFIVVAAVSGGYLIGLRHGHQATIRSLQTEAAGNLTQRIETLSLLRMADVSTAIMRLEEEADQLTLSIASNPDADQRVLAAVKAYLTVAPPSPPRTKKLSTALEGVPALDPSQCSTALKAFLLAAKADPAQRR